MNQTTELRDGALGYGSDDGKGLAVIGVATQGALNTPVLISQPQTAYDLFGTGKLPDRIAFHFANGGPGPVLALRAAASTAGSLPAYRVRLHADVEADDANSFPGPITALAAPRNVECDFAAGWDGGDITITGTDISDAAQSETIADTAGATVKGVKVFKTITAISKQSAGATNNKVGVFSGNKSAAAASSDSNMTTSGTPTEDLDVIAQMTRAGDIAAGGPACHVSYDGGDTFGAETAIPAGGVLAIAYGLTLTFVGAAAKVGDTFRFKTIGPAMTTGNMTDALAALSQTTYAYEFVHILGALTGSQAASVVSWLGTEKSAGRWPWALTEVRDYSSDSETDATYQTSVLADYSSVTEPHGRLVCMPTQWEHVLPGNRGIQRRSWAWTGGTQISRVPLSVHPGSPSEAGPLRGLFTPLTAVQPRTHDERINPGLGGTGGRFCTVQSFAGREYQGQWFMGDHVGLRSPGTRAAGTSDFSLLMNMRVVMEAARRMQAKNYLLLAKRLRTKNNGALLPSQAELLDRELSAYLELWLVTPGHCQSVRVVVSRTELIYTTKKLPYTAFIRPWAYALWVAAEIGFEAAITA